MLSQTDLRDMWKLLHPGSTPSCDIVEEHLSIGSIRCQQHVVHCHLAGEQFQIVRRKQFFLLENRRGRGEWGLFPPPTDPKIIEIWLNLRFISSEVRLLVGKTPAWTLSRF